MSQSVWGDKQTEFFFSLTPEIILNAIEKLGLRVTGRCLALNSMENRVYEIEIVTDNETDCVSDQFVIAKFYRPGRWSRNQILEEHSFLNELKEDEIPVIAPLKFEGKTLFLDDTTGLHYCLFPKKGGRMAYEMTEEQLEIVGRMLARIHNVGGSKESEHRLKINLETFAMSNLNYLLENKIIPTHLETQYKNNVEELCHISAPYFEGVQNIRIHGDCHWGNIITRDSEIFFIDFDDMLVGPAVQDIWLVVPGDDEYSVRRRNILLDAYETMRSFDYRTLKMVEPLRALRFIHFSAWIAKRWEDPAFKNAFAQFGETHYWDTQTRDLNEQCRKIKMLSQ